MNDLQDLRLIIASRFPIVVVETPEEPRVLGLLENVAKLEQQALFIWDAADGLRCKGSPQPQDPNAWGRTARQDESQSAGAEGAIPETQRISDALKHIYAATQRGIYALLDLHPYLADPVNVRLIRSTAQEYDKTARTLVMISHRLQLPEELRRLSARFSLELPDAAEIRKFIKDEARLHAGDGSEVKKGDDEGTELLVQQLVGMCMEDARRLVRESVRDDGAITAHDIARVLKAKRDVLGTAAVVDLELEATRMSDVAGLKNLKHWLAQRRAAFLGDAARMGLDAPKGVLLLGVQGGGKSLAAKAVAGTWQVPLLRLDFATLYNKWLGETERNMRDALKFADAMAPCVLWMDEIEKGVATDTSDGGESRRLLGTILTWMAERKSKVFMVATANDIEALPPELIRKGRFDEIFFVDLPQPEIRGEILSIHLTRRRYDPRIFDVVKLAAASEGFSGAEIEQAIVSALYEAHAAQQPLSTEHVLAEMQRTRPLSVVMAEKTAALRAWAAERTVPAD